MADYLFCYDIADAKRLRRVHRYMCRHAAAVQKSVFLLSCSLPLRDACWAGLLDLVDEQADDIRCYCLSARGFRENLGVAMFGEGVIWTGVPGGL